MGDPSSPSSLIHSPPPPPRSNLPMLYYSLVVVGTAAVVLLLYNLVIVKWCSDLTDYQSRRRTNRSWAHSSSWRGRHSNTSFISSFKYKKDGMAVDGGGDSECSVCLSVFEEGEEVRQLPKCKHSFHAPCIDMWLYSHLDCPLCRSPVEPPALRPNAVVQQLEHSREVFLGPAIFV